MPVSAKFHQKCSLLFRLVVIPDCLDEVRLVDDAFAKICQAIGDLSVNVRTLAAELLGSMTHVNPHFLEQTLDKKLMSDMRVRFSCFHTCLSYLIYIKMLIL